MKTTFSRRSVSQNLFLGVCVLVAGLIYTNSAAARSHYTPDDAPEFSPNPHPGKNGIGGGPSSEGSSIPAPQAVTNDQIEDSLKKAQEAKQLFDRLEAKYKAAVGNQIAGESRENAGAEYKANLKKATDDAKNKLSSAGFQLNQAKRELDNQLRQQKDHLDVKAAELPTSERDQAAVLAAVGVERKDLAKYSEEAAKLFPPTYESINGERFPIVSGSNAKDSKAFVEDNKGDWHEVAKGPAENLNKDFLPGATYSEWEDNKMVAGTKKRIGENPPAVKSGESEKIGTPNAPPAPIVKNETKAPVPKAPADPTPNPVTVGQQIDSWTLKDTSRDAAAINNNKNISYVGMSADEFDGYVAANGLAKSDWSLDSNKAWVNRGEQTWAKQVDATTGKITWFHRNPANAATFPNTNTGAPAGTEWTRTGPNDALFVRIPYRYVPKTR